MSLTLSLHVRVRVPHIQGDYLIQELAAETLASPAASLLSAQELHCEDVLGHVGSVLLLRMAHALETQASRRQESYSHILILLPHRWETGGGERMYLRSLSCCLQRLEHEPTLTQPHP